MMSLICSVDTCLSNHTTEVDGRSIKFYPLPNDEKIKKQWQTICESICTTNVMNNNLFRLCELHFEKSNFTQNMQLKSKSIPTIFDLPKKRKAERLFPISTTKVNSPAKRLKQNKNDNNNYKNESMFTPQSEVLTSAPLPAKVGRVGLQNLSSLQPQSLNNPLSSGEKLAQVYHCSYRLLIQIDKIRSKPGPKSKKLRLSSHLKNKSITLQETLDECAEAFQKSINESIQQNVRISDQDRFTESDHSVIEIGQSNNSFEKSDMNLKKSDQNNLKKLDQNHLRNAGQNKIHQSSKNNLSKSSQNHLNQSSQHNLNKSSENCSNDTQIKPVQKNSDQSNLKNNAVQQLENLIKPSTVVSVCKTGCKLQKVIFNKSPAFRCGICNNIYIPQPIDEKTNTQNQRLYPQMLENLTCDICYCVFKTKVEYRKHMRLHTYMNPSTPFQCHLCNSVFNTKPNTRKHILAAHGSQTERKKQQIFLPKISADLQCKLCNLTFKDEESLRNHVKSHKETDEKNERKTKQIFLAKISPDLQCNLCNLTFKAEESLRNHMKSHEESDKAATPLGQLKPVKFACAVCSMQFTTLAEINAHMKIHVKDNMEDRRCNVCSQFFPNDQILSQHLRDHVTRAHRCHLCPKAFVTKSNLRIHLMDHV